VAAAFNRRAQRWWTSVVAEPHSFTKQTFQLGLGGWRASNVEASGAFEISRGKTRITKPAEFTDVGGRVCIKMNVRGGLSDAAFVRLEASTGHVSCAHCGSQCLFSGGGDDIVAFNHYCTAAAHQGDELTAALYRGSPWRRALLRLFIMLPSMPCIAKSFSNSLGLLL
jgi:hypothetical protein